MTAASRAWSAPRPPGRSHHHARLARNPNALSSVLLTELHAAFYVALTDVGRPGRRAHRHRPDLLRRRRPEGSAEQPWRCHVPMAAGRTDLGVGQAGGVPCQRRARAGGIGLIAACDIVVAAEQATFAFTEVRIGVVPAIISVTCLRRMPPSAAAEYFLTGEIFGADRAVQIGLVSRVVAAADLDADHRSVRRPAAPRRTGRAGRHQGDPAGRTGQPSAPRAGHGCAVADRFESAEARGGDGRVRG